MATAACAWPPFRRGTPGFLPAAVAAQLSAPSCARYVRGERSGTQASAWTEPTPSRRKRRRRLPKRRESKDRSGLHLTGQRLGSTDNATATGSSPRPQAGGATCAPARPWPEGRKALGAGALAEPTLFPLPIA